VEDWAEIRRLHRAEGMPVKAIARAMGISRNTVRAALASDVPPRYQRVPAGSGVDAFEPRIRELRQAYPMMPATVIAGRAGWERGLTVLKDPGGGELRPAYLPPDPASRTAYDPGELAQCDFWFPPVTVPAGFGQERRPVRLPVLTMVSGYSRWLPAVLVPPGTPAGGRAADRRGGSAGMQEGATARYVPALSAVTLSDTDGQGERTHCRR